MLLKGDFHIHSTASDGSLSPEEIIIVAKEQGLDTIAITDHNTITGIEKEIIACKKHKITIIPGVELSTRFNGESVHILGYFRNKKYTQSNLEYALEAVKAHKAHKVRNILKMRADQTSSSRYLSVPEGIHLLKKYGAAVVLAHPARISKKTLKALLNMHFDGLEARYCLHSAEETNFFIELAKSRFSFYTGGSDFHTNKRKELMHCVIGKPSLAGQELQRFLKKSGVLLID